MAKTLGVAFGVAEVVKFGKESVEAAAKFQSAMELIHTQAGASQKEVAKLSKEVLGLAGQVGTGPEKLAEGLYHLESQGLRSAKAMAALKIAAEGARVGHANLEDVTNALGAVMVSGIKGAKNLKQVMGELNATVGAGDMRMQDLADALGTGLTAKAAVAGVAIKDVSAALAVFGDNNIRGADAGTKLGSAIRLLSAPSKAAEKQLRSIGITGLQLADTLRNQGLVPAMELLKTKMEAAGLTASQQSLLLTRAFGGKQATGINILITQMERLKTKEEEVGKGGNKFGEDWKATTKTAQFHWDQLMANLDVLKIKIGNAVLPALDRFVQYINKHFPEIQRQIGDIIQALKPFGTALGNLLRAAQKVVEALGGWKPVVIAVAALWVSKFTGLAAFLKAFWLEFTAEATTATTAVKTDEAAMATSAEASAARAQVAWKLAFAAIAGYALGLAQQQLFPDPEVTKRMQRIQLGGKSGITYDPNTGKYYAGAKGAQIEVSMKEAAKELGISVDRLRAEIAKLTAAQQKKAQADAAGGETTRGAPRSQETTRGAPRSSQGKLPGRKAPAATTQQQQLLDFAKMLLGTPYVYGAMSQQGIDCSGLVTWAYGKLGIGLPHSTYAQVGMGKFVTGGTGGMSRQQMARLRPGDVIFSQYGEGGRSGPGHEALYVGGGQVEVARHPGTRVQYQAVSAMIGGGAYSVRRFLGDVAPGDGFDPSILDTGPGSGTSRSRRRRGRRGPA